MEPNVRIETSRSSNRRCHSSPPAGLPLHVAASPHDSSSHDLLLLYGASVGTRAYFGSNSCWAFLAVACDFGLHSAAVQTLLSHAAGAARVAVRLELGVMECCCPFVVRFVYWSMILRPCCCSLPLLFSLRNLATVSDYLDVGGCCGSCSASACYLAGNHGLTRWIVLPLFYRSGCQVLLARRDAVGMPVHGCSSRLLLSILSMLLTGVLLRTLPSHGSLMLRYSARSR